MVKIIYFSIVLSVLAVFINITAPMIKEVYQDYKSNKKKKK